MANLNPLIAWKLEVSGNDLTLILKALAGRLNEPDGDDYRAAADALGDQITAIKAKVSQQVGASGDIIAKNLAAKQASAPTPPEPNRRTDPSKVGRGLRLEANES